VPLTGVPEDREDKLLKGLIRDRSRLVQFLTLLLADDGSAPEGVGFDVIPAGMTSAASGATEANVSGLFELFVRALDRCPERLDDVAGLVREFMSESTSSSVLPEHFEAIWRPIWEARTKLPWQNQ
jgi:hypothetical protein